MPEDDAVVSTAERLAQGAADRAAALALANADARTKLAVDRAVKDANIDRDLREHAQHLAEINGSQRDMARSLEQLQGSLKELTSAFQTQLATQEVLADAITKRQAAGAAGWSRRAVWVSIAGVIAAYLSIIILIALSVFK